jgi:hypothetical protein
MGNDKAEFLVLTINNAYFTTSHNCRTLYFISISISLFEAYLLVNSLVYRCVKVLVVS